MTKIHCGLLLILGFTICSGCGDTNPQPWEGRKSQAAGGQPAQSGAADAKSDDVANNDATEPPNGAGQVADPHAGISPHAGTQMTSEAASGPVENDGKLDLGALHWTLPKAWIRKSPSMMLLAEYAIPKTEGDKENGRLTIMQAGGTLESNVDRWKGQFSKLEKQNDEKIDVEKVKVTLVDLAGTFEGMPGSGGPHADYRMIGAIAEVPGDKGMLFIKCYGPAKTMAARADEIKVFIRSMKVDK